MLFFASKGGEIKAIKDEIEEERKRKERERKKRHKAPTDLTEIGKSQVCTFIIDFHVSY